MCGMNPDSHCPNVGAAPRSVHLRERRRMPGIARERVAAELFDGPQVTARTYRYIASLTGVSQIVSGDYLDWVRSRL